MPLNDILFRLAYTPENCADFVAEFYEPALAQAVRYDRTTYTFSANGLKTAARGIAGLLANGGRIRLICDHKVTPETHAAIVAGRQQAAAILRQEVAPADLTAVTPNDITGKQALDLLTWLVAENRLDIRVAIVPDNAIFHDKIGIIADAEGNYIAFHGSLNETRAGAQENYESFDVFTSWCDPKRVADKVEQFETLWDGQSRRAHVIPLPDEYDAYLREYDARNRQRPALATPDERATYWQRIRDAVREDPTTTIATIPTKLWPHQAAFFNRHTAGAGPDRLLLADEVGLGKTIQAGSLLKLRLNQGRVSRLLVLAPKPACRQWQEELQRKFNISIPLLDTGGRPTLTYPDGSITEAANPPWVADRLIASYQWLRHHKDEFLRSEPQYDMVIVDEAHRARFSEVANESRRRPNQYLELLRELAKRTESLLLLTATPMQMHEAELHALLELLEPVGWTAEDFRAFYDADAPATAGQWQFMADIYRPHSPNPAATDERLIHSGNAAYVTSRLDTETITRTAGLMRERGPARRLMSRHTRATLRQYAREGRIQAVVPNRQVHPVAIPMNDAERRLYDDIDDLVSEVYASAPGVNPTALGFIMTTYRKRLGSSPRAFAQTCCNHLTRQQANAAAWQELARLDDEELDDDPDAPLPGTTLTPHAMARLEQAAHDAGQLERRDTKLGELRRQLDDLAGAGHRKVIIFTQFRDTMLYLQERLAQHGCCLIVCLSGQDDPAQGSRAQRIKTLRDADAGLLIGTETASESLNLQFCSAMVNYDIPWNPMTLEQRIGRIDRIGQARPMVDIVNLFYAGTAEWDAYEAMLERLEAIRDNVGEYQPILYDPASANRMSAIIRANGDRESTRAAVQNIAGSARINLDTLNSALEQTALPVSAITMADIQRALAEPGLLPEGWAAEHRGGAHWKVTRPDGSSQLVTTDLNAYHYGGANVVWFGPGSPWWPS